MPFSTNPVESVRQMAYFAAFAVGTEKWGKVSEWAKEVKNARNHLDEMYENKEDDFAAFAAVRHD